MDIPDILAMKDRRYMMIPVEKTKVINPRIRDEEQFQMNVQSIENNGMLMPIRVNDKFLEKTGFYELICGEGRLIAHQRLGKSEIKAEVITCTRKEAYLQSLIENLARSRPGTMEFARELKQLHDEGWDYAHIGKLCCRSPEYVRQYIGLVKQGEDRLIQGVEQGVFPISFAMLVAQSENGDHPKRPYGCLRPGDRELPELRPRSAHHRRQAGAGVAGQRRGKEESCWPDCNDAQEGHCRSYQSQGLVRP